MNALTSGGHLRIVRPSAPVRVGDAVHVPEPVTLPSGRRLPRGPYAVLAVERTPDEHRHLGPYRLVVEATPDTSRLHDRRMHRPSADEIRDGATVPLAAQAGRFYVYPGDFTRYRSGHVETLPDHPLQTD